MRVHINSREAFYTDIQVKKSLLCNECEQIFTKHGENKLARLWATHDEFPLLDLLRSLPIIEGPKFSMSDPKHLDADLLKSLFYFAVSVIWRSNCWEWGKHPSVHRGTLGEHYEKAFAAFLLCETNELVGVRLIVTVNTNPGLNSMLSFPYCVKRNGCGFHRFDVLGIHFCLLVGRNPDAELSLPFEKTQTNTIILMRDMALTEEVQNLAKSFCSMFPHL
ncbi:hypothetical protein ACIQSO_22255 [Pseudomonas putida]|uniref:hypothetical protein n=1 Tax=Pseudomonas putida TaxID=303 RepID=UPI00383B472D